MNALRRIPLTIVLAACFLLLLTAGARMHPLWGDEAETALFARNILSYGIPRGWDGVNLMGISDGAVLNRDLVNHVSPWLQYYAAAASFAVFGQNDFTARLPFIATAVLSVFVYAAAASRIVGGRMFAGIAVLIFIMNVQVILFSFQARYYSLVTLFSLLFFLSCTELVRPRRRTGILFILSASGLFYSQYLSFITYLTGVCTAFVLYYTLSGRHAERNAFLRGFFRFIPWVVVCTVPWIVFMRPGGTVFRFGLEAHYSWPGKIAAELTESFFRYNESGAFPVLFVVPYLVLLWRGIRDKTKDAAVAIPFIAAAVILTLHFLLTTVIVTNTYFDEVRYTFAVTPLLLLASAYVIFRLMRRNTAAGALLLAVFIGSNTLTLTRPRSHLLEFFSEAIRPYRTPDILVAQYLETHARDGDTAFVSLDRNHEPLIFRLGKKIRFINRVNPNNPKIFPSSVPLPGYVAGFKEPPDWVILYGKNDYRTLSFETFDYRGTFPLGLSPLADLANDYTEHVIPVYFADRSRPELNLRSFVGTEPAYREQVFIYRKK